MGTINDKITSVTDTTGSPAVTTVSSSRAPGAVTLSVVSTDKWPADGSKVHGITYKKTADNKIDKSTQQNFMALKTGTTLSSFTITGGTDLGNDPGDFVELAPTPAWSQDLYDGLTQTLNIDGTLKNQIVTENKYADASIPTTAYKPASITPEKLSGGFKVVLYKFTATGSASITGVGFKPKGVMVFLMPPNHTSGVILGYGASDGTDTYWYRDSMNTTSAATAVRANQLILTHDSAGNLQLDATLTSFDSDGMTMNVNTFANNVSYSTYMFVFYG